MVYNDITSPNFWLTGSNHTPFTDLEKGTRTDIDTHTDTNTVVCIPKPRTFSRFLAHFTSCWTFPQSAATLAWNAAGCSCIAVSSCPPTYVVVIARGIYCAGLHSEMPISPHLFGHVIYSLVWATFAYRFHHSDLV